MSRELRLTPTYFHLLLCLADGAKHGYVMMQEIDEQTSGKLRLGPSSLYHSLGRLEEAGLIRETAVAGADDEMHAERRRYYELTPAGRRRLKSEVGALAQVLEHARARYITG